MKLPFRYRVRNLLVRLRLMPVETRTERAYQRGREAAASHARISVDIAERESHRFKSEAETTAAQNEQELKLIRLLAEAEPYHLNALRKKAKKLLAERDGLSSASSRCLSCGGELQEAEEGRRCPNCSIVFA